MNLKDLARQLGLSQTTVSRALNGYDDVSEETRQRVIAMAKAGGYQPNPTARRLAIGRENAVGIIYPLDAADLGDPQFLEVVGGMTEALDRVEMDLLISSASPANELRSYQRTVKGRRVDGLIVARTRVHDPRLELLQEANFPFVAYGRSNLAKPYAWFDFDNEAGLELCVARLAKLGHQHIALLGASPDFNFSYLRQQGFQRGMQDAGLTVNPDYVVHCSLDRRGGYQGMAALLALPQPPTAVVVDNSLCGVGALRAIADARLEIGKDISIIVYDGLPSDTLVGHSVTAVLQPTPHKVGVKLVELMLARLAGKPIEALQVLWQPELQVGDSDGPVPQQT